jgi:hypothetical protein
MASNKAASRFVGDSLMGQQALSVSCLLEAAGSARADPRDTGMTFSNFLARPLPYFKLVDNTFCETKNCENLWTENWANTTAQIIVINTGKIEEKDIRCRP